MRLDLAERVFINQGCTFLDFAGVRLGARVLVAPTVTCSPSVTRSTPRTDGGWLTGGPIDVAEKVWIGAGAAILPGVGIGQDPVIAAGVAGVAGVVGAVGADDVPARSPATGTKATVRRHW